MPLNSGLYKSQDQTERDLTEGPGWTIDQQKPTFFSGLGAAPLFRGIGQGAAEGISVLTQGLQFPSHESDMDAVMNGPAAAARATERMQGKPTEEPAWHQDWNAGAAEVSANARDFSKTLVADPRTTGTAANLVQGFSKAVTEFTAGSAAGGPVAGAVLLGASDGYAHYQDLRDQGVDDETAKKSGLLAAMTSGGSAILPLGMPARWLKGLSTVGTLGAQAGAGAVINTSFGAASRYASGKILEDAGYPEQAAQEKPWDETNLLTDAISGLFFGAHAGWHGIKGVEHVDPANVDPSIRDAAKVVQDRQAVLDRAPGVPVDMRSGAVHRELLESAMGDLMTGKPVDSSHIDSEGATFARPEVDETQAHEIMRDEFVKSGVLDEAASFDRWLKGEAEPKLPEVPAQSVKPEPGTGGEGYDVGEQEMSDELRQKFEGLRSELRPEQELEAVGGGEPQEPVSGGPARGAAAGEPLPVHRGGNRPLSPDDFKPESFGHETGRPSSGLGVFFTNDKAEAAGYGPVSTHHLDIKNPLEMKSEDVPAFDSIEEATKWREKQRAKGYDGLVIDASHLGGQTWYVPFEHSQVYTAGKDLKIVNEHGEELSAAAEQARAVGEEAQANKEADPMFQAAVGCEARHL